jgi:3-oxoadipate enol-lactonase
MVNRKSMGRRGNYACPDSSVDGPIGVEDMALIHSVSLITDDGETLAVQAAGTGAPAVLLHGFPLDHRMWLPVVQRLSSRFQCLVPDLRGFGGSTLHEDYQLEDLARDVETIRRHLVGDRSIHLIGLSMGGYVAFEYWRQFGENLRSLTLANTKPFADDAQGKANRLEMSQKAISQGSQSALEPMVSLLLAEQSLGTQAESDLRKAIGSTQPESIVAAQTAMANRRDFEAFLNAIAVPTLVVGGQFDRLTPAETTQKWASQLPAGRFLEIPEAGHLTPLESPTLFHSALDEFLTSVGPTIS